MMNHCQSLWPGGFAGEIGRFVNQPSAHSVASWYRLVQLFAVKDDGLVPSECRPAQHNNPYV
jgi:hypothetical protein